MSVISLLVVLILIGVALWLVTTYIPMNPGIKRLIVVVGIVIAVIMVLRAFGILGGLNMQVPQVR
jgi:hypothetical protein